MENRYNIVPSIEFIYSSKFHNQYKSLDQSQKKDFLVNLGGKINLKKTQEFTESIVR